MVLKWDLSSVVFGGALFSGGVGGGGGCSNRGNTVSFASYQDILLLFLFPSNKANKLVKWAKLTQKSKQFCGTKQKAVNSGDCGYEAEFAIR